MSKQKLPFKSTTELCALVDSYFKWLDGEYRMEKKEPKKATEEPVLEKVTIREPEPATVAGLALHLGFSSRIEFENLERKGKYASVLKRARLRVEAAYEKKLYQQSSGVIFALKNLGWNDKADTENAIASTNTKITIKVVETGPKPVSTENEVSLL